MNMIYMNCKILEIINKRPRGFDTLLGHLLDRNKLGL